jgi:hypothetical protein
MSKINNAVVPKRKGPGHSTRSARQWLGSAGGVTARGRGGAAAVMGDIAHRGTNEPARQDARALLPKWMEETW